ncbi:MAG: YggS family pyridoxal phosphate-dependent enzyme [Sphingobacteriales bacterium]|nr:MAG: YggS family pyridoxal phosphate-dependent enzyme [Sphingobacteriales bacterium]
MQNNFKEIKKWCDERKVNLVAISKTHPVESITLLYKQGQRMFGENKVQEIMMKECQLTPDVQWHLVGHLQTNKVKFIAPFVSLIHSVDSLKLLQEINKQAQKNERIQNVLLQIFIADEKTKFGLSEEECFSLLENKDVAKLKNIRIEGLMGMATNTDDEKKIGKEFKILKKMFDKINKKYSSDNIEMQTLSMGMSSDYKIAVEEGSNMVRLGSVIFGERKTYISI